MSGNPHRRIRSGILIGMLLVVFLACLRFAVSIQGAVVDGPICGCRGRRLRAVLVRFPVRLTSPARLDERSHLENRFLRRAGQEDSGTDLRGLPRAAIHQEPDPRPAGREGARTPPHREGSGRRSIANRAARECRSPSSVRNSSSARGSALLDREPCPATVTALEDTECVFLTRDRFVRLMNKLPEIPAGWRASWQSPLWPTGRLNPSPWRWLRMALGRARRWPSARSANPGQATRNL